MNIHIPFIFAQLLGLCPFQGLWSSREPLNFSFRRLSIPFIYSLVTFLLRLAAKYFLLSIVSIWSMTMVHISTTVKVINFFTFSTTFSTGLYYQLITLLRSRRFLQFLKNLQQYDSKHGVPHRSGGVWCIFSISNVTFSLFTVAFPATVMASIIMTLKRLEQLLGGGKTSNAAIQYPYLFVVLFSLALLLVEASTVYPMLQLSYSIKAMEARLRGIHSKVLDYSKTNLLLLQENKLWATKYLQHQGAHYHHFDLLSNFWSSLCTQYLDYEGLFKTFKEFSGLYFVALFPIQLLSFIGMVYLNTQTAIFKDHWFVEVSMNLVMLLGIVRTWSLCNLGHRLDVCRNCIMSSTLRVDGTLIFDERERAYYQRFNDIIRYIPICLDASGIFKVARSNIPTILTALVSYFIVLLQFSGSTEPTHIGQGSGGTAAAFDQVPSSTSSSGNVTTEQPASGATTPIKVFT